MKNANEMKRFEVGNIYEMRFVTDSELKPLYSCTKRTAKTVTFEKFQRTEKITKRIKEWDGSEFIRYDTYSMAPSIYAKNIAG